MRPALKRLLPATLATIGVLAVPAAAPAATGMEIAVQDDHALVSQFYPSANRAETLDLASRFQTKWVRANVHWAASNGNQQRQRSKPANPTYDFGSFDQLILAAQAKGMQVELTITGNVPAWAAGNKKVGPYKPNVKYFGEFVRAVVRHFGGFVHRYAIWNEPNLVSWLAPFKSAPSLYRSLYKAGYKAVKAENPSAQVLIGETSPYGSRNRSHNPIAFIRKFAAGQKLLADGYAHHPYDFQHKPTYRYPGSTNATLGTISNLTKELDRQAKAKRLRTPGGKALDVYITEYGYMRSGKYGISESKRAQYLRQAWTIALKNRRIKQMLQYLVIQPTRKFAFFDMSLANRSGNTFGAAFDALVDWTSDNQTKINGARR